VIEGVSGKERGELNRTADALTHDSEHRRLQVAPDDGRLGLGNLTSEYVPSTDGALRTPAAEEGNRQFDSTATRFSKPVSANRWTVRHSHQAVNPDTRTDPMLASA
jgi:hypothetical protein